MGAFDRVYDQARSIAGSGVFGDAVRGLADRLPPLNPPGPGERPIPPPPAPTGTNQEPQTDAAMQLAKRWWPWALAGLVALLLILRRR